MRCCFPLWILVILISALFFAGCFDLSGPGNFRLPPTGASYYDYLAPTSPQNVLSNLVLALNHKDFDGFEEILHPDFTFHAVPSGPDTPFERDRSYVLDCAEELFANTNVTIQVMFPYMPADVELFGRAAKITVASAQAVVDIRDEGTYALVSRLEFWFKPNPTDPSVWLLYEWWEIEMEYGFSVNRVQGRFWWGWCDDS